MFEHGVNVVDRSRRGRQAGVLHVSEDLRWRWPDTENAHGSPPDWCRIRPTEPGSACTELIDVRFVRLGLDRVHDLRIDGQGAGSNERGEVHGVHLESGHERPPEAPFSA
jgi:hypothetical protein